jgi:hypothetical protein
VSADGRPAVFDLKAGGLLYQFRSDGFTLLDNQAQALAQGVTADGRPAVFDLKVDGLGLYLEVSLGATASSAPPCGGWTCRRTWWPTSTTTEPRRPEGVPRHRRGAGVLPGASGVDTSDKAGLRRPRNASGGVAGLRLRMGEE